MTTSTLAQQNILQPESSFGECRVRMNVIVSTEEARYVKNKWAGRDLTIGDAVRLNLALPDPRCVMTTLAQDELPWYPEILRTLVRHNRIQVGDGGQFLCAVTYSVVLASGTMQTGDHVSLTRSQLSRRHASVAKDREAIPSAFRSFSASRVAVSIGVLSVTPEKLSAFARPIAKCT